MSWVQDELPLVFPASLDDIRDASVQVSESDHVHIRYDDGGAYEVPCECLCGDVKEN